MGLLSGGQVLRGKRQLLGRLFGSGGDAPGNAVTDYGAHKIRHLKTQLAAAMNAAADQLDDITRRQLIDESRECPRTVATISLFLTNTSRLL